MTALGMLLAGFGVVLIMAGVKGEDVRDVIAAPFRRANEAEGVKPPRNANQPVFTNPGAPGPWAPAR